MKASKDKIAVSNKDRFIRKKNEPWPDPTEGYYNKKNKVVHSWFFCRWIFSNNRSICPFITGWPRRVFFTSFFNRPCLFVLYRFKASFTACWWASLAWNERKYTLVVLLDEKIDNSNLLCRFSFLFLLQMCIMNLLIMRYFLEFLSMGIGMSGRRFFVLGLHRRSI